MEVYYSVLFVSVLVTDQIMRMMKKNSNSRQLIPLVEMHDLEQQNQCIICLETDHEVRRIKF